MDSKEEMLAKCARLLSKSTTDDEKLAGLLLVSKVVPVEDAQSLLYIFESMDPRFLERLMRTGVKQTAKNASSPSALLSIAVSVIGVFASHSQIAQQQGLLDRIPTLIKVAALNIDIVSQEAIQAICQIMAADAATRNILEQPQQILDVASPLLTLEEINGDIVELLDFVLNRCSTFICSQDSISRYAQGWVLLLELLARAFDKSQSKSKFLLLSLLAHSLEPLALDDALSINDTASCATLVSTIASGCIWILKQKSETNQYADQALVLYSHLVRLWPEHAFSSPSGQQSRAETGSNAVLRKDAELVLRLACIEGQAAIDTMMISEPENGSGKASAIEIEQERTKLGWKLPICAEIVAGWLDWIGHWIEDQADPNEADEKTIHALMTEAQKLAQAAISFLADYRDRVESSVEMIRATPDLLLCITRFLALWLSTDPKLHQAAMPFLSMCTDWILHESGPHDLVIKEYMRPCISFALETREISEAQFVDDLKTRQSHHAPTKPQENASPWVGTIEFDDLARAIYGIPSDEAILRAR